MKKFIVRLFYLLCLIQSHSVIADVQVHATQSFISVADIHFDPFAGCKKTLAKCAVVTELRHADAQQWGKILSKYDKHVIPAIGKDTNYYLFKLTLDELTHVRDTVHPQFALILGDFLAHQFREKYFFFAHDPSDAGYEAFVRKTIEYMTLELHHVFSDIDVYPVIGNNDSYTGDYSVVPKGKFLQDMAEVWSMFFVNKNNRATFLQTFPQAGYYEVTLANKTQKIILLDTVLFSARAKNIKGAAQAQLAWLQTRLIAAGALKQHVLVAFHIPMGVDVYNTLKKKFGSISEYWYESYAGMFSDILKRHAAILRGILAGHIHVDSLKLITVNQIANVPVIITPSISPIFGNNPGFKVFNYDAKSFVLENHESYVLLNDLKWQKE